MAARMTERDIRNLVSLRYLKERGIIEEHELAQLAALEDRDRQEILEGHKQAS